MNNWKHINFEQRKLIVSFLSKNMKLCEIADLLNLDPTSISKEIKRNRYLSKKGKTNKLVCKHTLRFPYCCNGCPKKYHACTFNQFRYDARRAQSLAEYRLVNSRVGLNMSLEHYNYIDKTIKDGVDDKKSIYHIVKSNPDINLSVSSVYRLINNKQLSTHRMDLPYAVSYKKRKSNKQYEYRENSKIDRTGRTYIDFLAFKHNNPGKFHVQMDFLGAIKNDNKNILTLTIPELHFIMLFIIDKPNAQKVNDIFNALEDILSTKTFNSVFPYILTDRDPCFSNFIAIEQSFLNSYQRTHIFYCDSFNSAQKGNVEQMNKQLRKFFRKGKSVDHIEQSDIKDVEHIINNTHIKSLSGSTPKEAFIKIYGQDSYNKLSTITIK